MSDFFFIKRFSLKVAACLSRGEVIEDLEDCEMCDGGEKVGRGAEGDRVGDCRRCGRDLASFVAGLVFLSLGEVRGESSEGRTMEGDCRGRDAGEACGWSLARLTASKFNLGISLCGPFSASCFCRSNLRQK